MKENRTVFERGVDANAICQALAKYFQEHPEVKINLMNLASDMSWICKYLEDNKHNPQIDETGLIDMLMGINEYGSTTTAFYVTYKNPNLYVDHDSVRFIRCVFTRVGDGLQCKWIEITKKEAQGLVKEWNDQLMAYRVLEKNFSEG